MRPAILDLFCGNGGAAMGYFNGGFEVHGVDIEPRPRYPFESSVGDACTWPLTGWRYARASPPCNDHSPLSGVAGKHGTGWMLQHTIDRFRAASGLLWEVENVEGATIEPGPGETLTMLCGTHFGLGAEGRVLKRHRQFLTNFAVPDPGPCICRGMPVGGVYGDGGGGRMGRGHKFHAAASRHAMEIDWMDRPSLSQAIPPKYTLYLANSMRAAAAAMHDNGGIIVLDQPTPEAPTVTWCPLCGHPNDIHHPEIQLPRRHPLDTWCAACPGEVCRWTP